MNDSIPGYTTVPNWMMAAEDVTGNMVLVYAALGSYTDREGAAWPSVSKLSKRAKVSDSTCRRALDDLEALGLVERVGRASITGAQTSNLYRLHTAVIPPLSQGHPLSEGQGAPVRVTDEQAPLEQPSTDVEGEKRARARATRIPEPFIVTAAMWEWCREKGFDLPWAREQTERFVDYWRGIPGQRGTKLDWEGTWRNWLRRSWDERRSPSAAPARETPDQRFARLMAQAEAMESGQTAVEA